VTEITVSEDYVGVMQEKNLVFTARSEITRTVQKIVRQELNVKINFL
jgi:hypothetical protein